jgi:hypothetical protein
MPSRRYLRKLDAIIIRSGILTFLNTVEDFTFVRATIQQWLFVLVLVLLFLFAIQIFLYRT